MPRKPFLPLHLSPAPRLHAACLLAVISTAITVVAPLDAQSLKAPPVRLETFAARNESAASTLFGGVSLSAYSGLLGFRVAGAASGFDFGGGSSGYAPVRSCSRFGCRTVNAQQYGGGDLFSVAAWTADADVIAEPFRTTPVLRQLLLGFSPYAFVGVGRFSTNSTTPATSDTSLGVWSYGLGAHHDLIGRLGLTAEARVRRTLEDNAFVGGTFRSALQYRLGVNVGLGGGVKREPPRPVITSRRILPAPAGASTPTPVVAAAPSAPPLVSERTAASTIDERVVATVVPALLDAAESLVNVRWHDGGTTPDDGFDAGSFVQHVFGQENIALPRLVRELASTGIAVPVRVGTLRPGDLLLFSNDGTTADHVAIFVGHDRFVHASASGGGVRYDVLGEDARGAWFAEHLIGARRVVGVSGGVRSMPVPLRTPSGRPGYGASPVGGAHDRASRRTAPRRVGAPDRRPRESSRRERSAGVCAVRRIRRYDVACESRTGHHRRRVRRTARHTRSAGGRRDA